MKFANAHPARAAFIRERRKRNSTDKLRRLAMRPITMVSVLMMGEWMNWISVEERLPKMWDEVLIAHGYHKGPSVDVAFYSESDEWQLQRTDSQDNAVPIPCSLVTHWMPLPEPPSFRESDSPDSASTGIGEITGNEGADESK